MKQGKPKQEEMTLDILATMTQGAFNRIDDNFKEVNTRFDTIDRRFDGIDKRLDRIENILLASHQNQIDQLRDTVLRIATFVHLPQEQKKRQ